MKAYFLSLFESFTWRFMSGSVAWMISSFVLVTLLAAGTASATTRITRQRPSVTPTTTTQSAPTPTVFDELLNIVTRMTTQTMTTQTERVVSKRL